MKKRDITRNCDNLNVIFLEMEGNGPWYKAYGWSAYLAANYPLSNKTLKVIKNNGDVYVSLKFEHFKNFFPGCEIKTIKSNVVEICVDIEKYGNITIENYNDFLISWKTSIKEIKKEKFSNFTNKPYTLLLVFKEIIRYDTYNKKEDELRNFIISLKEMCGGIIC